MEFKRCPMKFNSSILIGECYREQCAWWCSWAECCAMVAIPAEISDRVHDIMQTIQN